MLTNTKEIGAKENILIYGKAGVGKTSLVKTLDCKESEVLIIDADRGTRVLADKEYPVIQIKNLNDAFNAVRYIKKNVSKYKWVVVDALSELSSIFLSELKEKNSDTRQAYMKMGDYVLDFIKQVRELPTNKYFISHESRVEDQDDGSVQYCPALEGSAVKARLPQFFDIILVLRTFKNDEGKIIRKLQSGGDVKYITKDRTGRLEDFEELNLQALFNKIQSNSSKTKAKPAESNGIHHISSIVQQVAETFAGSKIEEEYTPLDVPEGEVTMELEGKKYIGSVQFGTFTFTHNNKQHERALAKLPNDAKFIKELN